MNIEPNAVGSPTWLVAIIAIINTILYITVVYGTASRVFNPSSLGSKVYDVKNPAFVVTSTVISVLLYVFTGAFSNAPIILTYIITLTVNLLGIVVYNGIRYREIPSMLYIAQFIASTFFQYALIKNGYYYSIFH